MSAQKTLGLSRAISDEALAEEMADAQCDENESAWKYAGHAERESWIAAARRAKELLIGVPRSEEALRVKVERTCPRCQTRAYHYGNDLGMRNRIACVNCGHVWTGRIRNDEQRDAKAQEGASHG